MKKYDCSKVLDYIHERERLCIMYTKCEGCPLNDIDCAFVDKITPKHIDIVQKWSDENQSLEMPKITHEEYAFLQAFQVTSDKQLERRSGNICLVAGIAMMRLRPSMFQFIGEGEIWSLDKLLRLEVKE